MFSPPSVSSPPRASSPGTPGPRRFRPAPSTPGPSARISTRPTYKDEAATSAAHWMTPSGHPVPGPIILPALGSNFVVGAADSLGRRIYQCAAGDFDGDSYPDLIGLDISGEYTSPVSSPQSEIRLIRNLYPTNAGATPLFGVDLATSYDQFYTHTGPAAITVGDYNGDGLLDFFFMRNSSDIFGYNNFKAAMYINTGTPTVPAFSILDFTSRFQTAGIYCFWAANHFTSVNIDAHVTGDTDIDILAISADRIYVIANPGTASFTAADWTIGGDVLRRPDGLHRIARRLVRRRGRFRRRRRRRRRRRHGRHDRLPRLLRQRRRRLVHPQRDRHHRPDLHRSGRHRGRRLHRRRTARHVRLHGPGLPRRHGPGPHLVPAEPRRLGRPGRLAVPLPQRLHVADALALRHRHGHVARLRPGQRHRHRHRRRQPFRRLLLHRERAGRGLRALRPGPIDQHRRRLPRSRPPRHHPRPHQLDRSGLAGRLQLRPGCRGPLFQQRRPDLGDLPDLLGRRARQPHQPALVRFQELRRRPPLADRPDRPGGRHGRLRQRLLRDALRRRARARIRLRRQARVLPLVGRGHHRHRDRDEHQARHRLVLHLPGLAGPPPGLRRDGRLLRRRHGLRAPDDQQLEPQRRHGARPGLRGRDLLGRRPAPQRPGPRRPDGLHGHPDRRHEPPAP